MLALTAALALTAQAQDWGLPGVSQVQSNAYGYGTNMDQYGRAHGNRVFDGLPHWAPIPHDE